MKIKTMQSWKTIATAALVAGFLGMNSIAGVEQFSGPNGAMNVYDNVGGVEGSWLFYSGWGVPDLQAITTNNLTFELLPNINTYVDNPGDSYWRNNGGAGPDGNKFMHATTYDELTIAPDMIEASFSFDVETFDLDSRYTLVGFIKTLDPNDGYSLVNIAQVPITGTGTNTVSLNITGNNGLVLQAGWEMVGLNANPTSNWGSATVTITKLYADNGDMDPPSAVSIAATEALSGTSIKVTSSTATDASGVEYFFSNTVNNATSGWQSSTNWTDTGLSPSSPYTYKVKARDTSVAQSETDWSPLSDTVYTLSSDPNPPTPNPMTFADSGDASPISIRLTATTATDDHTVVEYFFSNTVNGVTSGWQSDTNYVETGLTPGSNYAYTVTARDLNSNTTTGSTELAVATLAEPASGAYSNALQGITGDTDNVLVVHELAKLGLTTGSINPNATISFSTNGATFGQGFDFSGRNVLKTIADGYEAVSFTAYATLTFSGAGDLSGYIGLGQGIQTGVPNNYGVPELNLAGVSGVVAEFKDSTAGGFANCQIIKIVDGDQLNDDKTAPVGSTETIRAKLVYSADSNTVSVSIDKNYAGGPFTADQDLGTVSTLLTNGVSMFTNAPVRVYVGGGEGTLVTDFEIIADNPVVPVEPFSIVMASPGAGSGTVLSWYGTAGHTYNVQYKNDLTAPTWTTDSSPGCSNITAAASGTLSATSTVSAAEVFYHVVTE